MKLPESCLQIAVNFLLVHLSIVCLYGIKFCPGIARCKPWWPGEDATANFLYETPQTCTRKFLHGFTPVIQPLVKSMKVFCINYVRI